MSDIQPKGFRKPNTAFLTLPVKIKRGVGKIPVAIIHALAACFRCPSIVPFRNQSAPKAIGSKIEANFRAFLLLYK